MVLGVVPLGCPSTVTVAPGGVEPNETGWVEPLMMDAQEASKQATTAATIVINPL